MLVYTFRLQNDVFSHHCYHFSCRHWLVIQEDGHKVTGRQEPRLVLITASSDDVYLYLNAAEMEELRVPLKLSRSNSLKDCRYVGLKCSLSL